MDRIEHTVDEVLQNEGIVYASRARSSGTVVGLYDTTKTTQFDPDGGRWATVCEDHSTIVNHETRRLAESFMACPEEWCQDCTEIVAAKDRPIEPEVDDSYAFDDGLIYIHQGKTAIVLTSDQAKRLGTRLIAVAS